jgi:predicted CoA-binding protein
MGVAVLDYNGDGWLDLFVGSDRVPAKLYRNTAGTGFVDEAITAGAKAIWMQLGVEDDAAAARAEAAGLKVVMNHCPKIEFRRLNLKPIGQSV